VEKFVKVIQDALDRQGLSASAASRAAVGNSALVKNLIHRRGEKQSHPLENIERLAEVLDLEFYFGPKRSRGTNHTPNWPGFAESQITIEGRPEALAHGYAPIPYLSEAGGTTNVSPIAVSRAWATDAGLDFDQLCVLTVLPIHVGDGLYEGDRVIVDRRSDADIDGRQVVFFSSLMGAAEVARIEEIGHGKRIAIRSELHERRLLQLGPATRIIGPVVGIIRFSDL